MDGILDEDSETDVICHAFRHQVGGHKCVLQITENLICKPCEKPERVFYSNVPKNLQPYVPVYRGEVTVRCEDNDGNKIMRARISNSVLKCQRLCETECSDTDTWSRSRLNHCIEEGTLWRHKQNEQFLMFDNLIGNYQRPCAVDIKLSQYYHGQCPDEKKRLKLEQKSNNSTSLSLGFRICGMQMYEEETGKFVKYNKYYGMTLNDHQAIQLLRAFFRNSSDENIRDISNTIRNMHNGILTQTDFLFLSVSLFFYFDDLSPDLSSLDSLEPNKSKGHDCNVRLIDFEKAVDSWNNVDKIPQHIKENINFGMTNLSNIIESFAVGK